MGSIMEYETCPNCGSEESYIRDYYYKSDEEYCFCSKCGHVHNYFMTNQKIRVVVPFKTLKKKIYDEASRKCIVKKNATLEEILNDLRSHDMRTYIIGKDERTGREGSIPEWANIHPRKQTVEFSVRKFKEEIRPGHGIIKYDNGKVAQLISLKRYPSKKAVEEMLKEAEGQDYRVTLITSCKAGKLEILYKEETVCTH